MAVGYRSFLSVEPGEPVVDTVIAEVTRWAHAKGIDTPARIPGWYMRDGNDAITVLDERIHESRVYRWRRHHPYAAVREMLRTTVTAIEDPAGESWLWTEIELPRDSEYDPVSGTTMMAVPAFLRELLAGLSCVDGRTPVAAEPQWIARSHLPDVMDYLADETRRGPVYVFSQGGQDAERFVAWAGEVTWELAGLGTAFLLNGAVEAEFNEMVGPRLAVTPGCVRTYQPGVALDDPAEPKRHQILSAKKIARYEPRALSHMLGLPQRERAVRVELPSGVHAVSRILVEREREERERVTGPRSRSKTSREPEGLRAENAVLAGQVDLFRHMARRYRESESQIRAALRTLEEHLGKHVRDEPDERRDPEREPAEENQRIGVS
ncbi:hypothetical protein G1H11_04635 [Phytoactinopolyspora alkaliphila]|uniref:Uncharacterized protein n=1 Tax=Phytoactinopolyspora alkaliphila TaxID=1783498 RepID=A0A6N9YHW4_9ACTN|nr:hypothetical protein [Phytoactinopolyspora alkaliphila]NED94593.1 hypothetical protein [Phytoactinopolyspora alkaliphila]